MNIITLPIGMESVVINWDMNIITLHEIVVIRNYGPMDGECCGKK